MNHVGRRLFSVGLAASLGLSAAVALGTPASALSNPPLPVLNLTAMFSSHPFTGAGSNASDIEGIGYVSGDNSLWVADDNGDRLWEIDADTGAYKSKLDRSAFEAAQAVGDVNIPAGTLSDPTRADDLESVVYDPTNDVLYATSGNCCNTPAGQPPYHPTVYKLTRQGGNFQPESWQALPEGVDATAAGWRPGSGIYIGKGSKIKTYNFATNAIGSDISLPVSPIVGIDFVDPNTAFVTTATVNTAAGRTTATSDSTIHRFDLSGSTWTANANWTFPLANTGMIDARDLSIVGDKFYVTDGYDSRSDGNHPVFVYTLDTAPVPVASFTAVPTSGRAPYTVQFTDTSTPLAPALGAPTSWDWNFGDGGAHATTQNASHSYTVDGSYTATLIASNASGPSDPVSQTITVKKATSLPGGYTLDGFGGLHPFRVGSGPQPAAVTITDYWLGWDIARGFATLSDGTGGYVLDGFGGLHPVRIGSGAKPPKVTGAEYWLGWDIARGIAVLPNKKGGYTVDAYGGIHGFALGSNGKPPAVFGVPYWIGQDMARGIAIMPNGKGGYVVDRTGALYPFKIGTGGIAPAPANNVYRSLGVPVQGVSVMFDGTGGFTVGGNGGLHGFGIGVNARPPAVAGATVWPGWDIARDVALLPDIP